MPDSPQSITFVYKERSDYLTSHADGAQVGTTPQANIYMGFYLERPWNPTKVTHSLLTSGQLGGVTTQEGEAGARASEPTLIRELQTGVVLSVTTAKQILQSLKQAIEGAEVLHAANQEFAAKQEASQNAQEKHPG
jgi:hypothetical protein